MMNFEIDAFKIFKEEHDLIAFKNKTPERTERRYSLFLSSTPQDAFSFYIKNGDRYRASECARKFCRGYLQLIQMGWEVFEKLEKQNNKNKWQI